MPASKEKNGTWRARFYYTDITGKTRETQKRGFLTKREAQEYEREFLNKSQYKTDMSFKSLTELYLEDLSTRLKENTMMTKTYLINQKIAPFFDKLKICNITPATVRKWQGVILKSINPRTNTNYTQTYIKTINNQLVAILNYAVKFYNLSENPCHKAGTIGKKNAEEMNVWCTEEFSIFIKSEYNQKPLFQAGFNILFWCGIRIGELLALTKEDIDLEKNTLRVNKSYQRIKSRDVITAPKTPRSNRIIELDDKLVEILREYLSKLYKLKLKDRIFNSTKHSFDREMKKIVMKENLKKIRIHDLRHSHATLLIHLGVNPVAISKRLGHEKLETTLNTYSHVYPNANITMLKSLNSVTNKN